MSKIITAVATLGIALLSGCASMSGSGIASSLSGDVRAALTWENGGHDGRMTAHLSTGETFSGPFFQVTRETSVETLSPLWLGWPYRSWAFPWERWSYWGPDVRFVKQYSGRVVANLEGPDGKHMRCRFDLKRPEAGMSGGGQGRCQLPGGEDIDAIFPPA